MYNLNLAPGLHDIELTMKEGVVSKYSQPLLVKKGPISLGWGGTILLSKIVPGEELVLIGQNLFAEDVSLELIDSTDHVQRLESMKFDPYGNQIKIQIPSSVGYGYHILRLRSKILPFENNAPGNLTACRRLYISGQDRTPYEIIFLTDGFLDCSIKGPVLVPKNKFISTWVTGFDTKVRLKMVSVQNPDIIQFGQATTMSSGNPEAGSNIFIPDEVPAGWYRVLLQALNDQGEVTKEGPPFWRLVEFK